MGKIPLERISILISPSEKQQLDQLAEKRGDSLSATARRAIQAYLYAIRSREKKAKSGKNHVE